jgi:pilus assembly protein Flp/PilA
LRRLSGARILADAKTGVRRTLTKEWLMRQFLLRFTNDQSGVTAIEYGLIAALIAVIIIVAVQLVGTNLSTTFTSIANAL